MSAQPAQQLITIPNVSLSHLHDGTTTPLAEGTLSLALITVQLPSQSPSTSGSTTPDLLPSYTPASSIDQWLILSLYDPATLYSLAPEPLFELPISAQSRILQMPLSSYIIPASLTSYETFNGPSEKKKGGGEEEDAAGFIKVTFSDATDGVLIETFESIIWGLASFSNSPPPIPARPEKGRPSVNEKSSDQDLRSALVLIDEANGTVLGELDSNIKITEDSSLSKEDQGDHEKEPVVVSFGEGVAGAVSVQPLSAAWKPTPNPTDSRIISFGDYVCRGIIYGAETLGKSMESGAEKMVAGKPATTSPLVFGSRTKSGIHASHKLTTGAVMISGKTVAVIGGAASMIGDRVGKTLGIQSTPGGAPPKGIKGLVNRSLVAFNAVADSVEISGKSLIQTGTDTSSKVLGHRYGDDAADVSRKVGGSVKNVALVYVDARGVTRKALLRSVGKSAIRAKMTDGREVMLTEDGIVGAPEVGPQASMAVANASSVAAGKAKMA